MDNNIKALFILPFILIVAAFFIGGIISFQPPLTPQENEVVNFVPEDLSIPEIHKAVVKIDLSNPLDIARPDVQAAQPQLQREQLSAAPEKKVTMIVMGELERRALIDGAMVREGDNIGNLLIKKIEPARVLVKNTASSSDADSQEAQHWLYLEVKP